MDCELLHDILRVSFTMRAHQKFQDNLNLDFKMKPTFWQPWLDTGESPKQLVHKQTTKWKRDRKSRLPEYTRKSDPKIQDGVVAAESFSETNSTDIVDISNHTFKNGCTTEVNTRHHNRVGINGNSSVDTPLDMTVRQRGLPPSYSQTINSPNYRSSSRPQVIANEDPAVREDIPSGMSMCDPIIDEHFRRSLGNDYHAIFHNNNVSKEQVPRKSPVSTPTTPVPPTSSVAELMDNTGLSVDEHFAKALGDTWFRLNSKDSEAKNNSSKNNLVTI